MTTTIFRYEFVRALRLAVNASEVRVAPILAMVELSADGGILKVRCANTDFAITVAVPCVGPLETVFLPARRLLRRVMALPGYYIDIGRNGSSVEITSADTVVTFGAASYSDDERAKPVRKIPHDRLDVAFPADVLPGALKSMMTAVSTEETRYYLNGVFVEIKGGRTLLTATNGHKLEHRDMGDNGLGKAEFGGIIPRVPAGIMASVRDTDAGSRLTMWSGGAVFESGPVTIETRLIDGTFPDWRRVVPTPEPTDCVIEIDARTIASALKAFCRVDPFVSSEVAIVPNDAGVDFRQEASAGETVSASVDARVTNPKVTAVDADYLRRTMSLHSGVTPVRFKNNGSPIVIGSDSGFMSVLMPRRMRDEVICMPSWRQELAAKEERRRAEIAAAEAKRAGATKDGGAK